MATSKPITWLISDVLNWFKSKELVINESFQRHSVWSPQAKTLLIDSILNELPLPKIFIRTKIDAKLQKSVKEIVDGQQRIRSIVEFANDEFALNSKSENFKGMKYSDLSEETQEAFLGYVLTAEQLLNATDDDVIDIFARLNSYTVALNAAEKRHAAFQTELKFFVRRMSIKFRWFIEKYSVFTVKQRFRMADDEFFAEIVRLVVNGIQDGGAAQITKFYKDTSDEFFNEKIQHDVETSIDETIRFLDRELGAFLKGSLGKHYQIYALCATYLHIKAKIPRLEDMPPFGKIRTNEDFSEKLLRLEKELDDDFDTEFKKASSSSTQRIRTRKTRIKAFINAIGE
ncbi:MAG: DUF262 domain-containing protein [Syntrophales bacterium]